VTDASGKGEVVLVERVDVALVRCGLARSRAQASELISSGLVFLHTEQGQQRVTKASQKIPPSMTAADFLIKKSEIQTYVSRAGRKLASALRHVDLNVANFRVLDIGQSTGGFTHCLLLQGASQVLGIDVGHGQLDASLREDARVIALEKTHIKDMSRERLEEIMGIPHVDLVVIDLSFISVLKALPLALHCIHSDGHVLALVKPQFEVGRKGLNRQGLVKDPLEYDRIRQAVIELSDSLGCEVLAYFPSEILGSDGNREFWCYLRKL
jgi:23S rRNA (cytidine1920-2'-O)/16S rRNA (cytidine1409-2'-O)-methyltransferase